MDLAAQRPQLQVLSLQNQLVQILVGKRDDWFEVGMICVDADDVLGDCKDASPEQTKHRTVPTSVLRRFIQRNVGDVDDRLLMQPMTVTPFPPLANAPPATRREPLKEE
jgi:hypothetical protein